MESMKFFDAIRDTILMAVHQQEFKSGVFKTSITNNTSTVEALNLLVSSTHLSSSEKEITKAFLKPFRILRKRFTGEMQPGIGDVVGILGPMQALTDMFTADVKARGGYVPPTMVQVLNGDGSVEETHSWDDAREKGTVTQGGVVGVPPGAPESYLEAHKENIKEFGEAAKSFKGQVLVGNRFCPKTVVDVSKNEQANSIVDSAAEEHPTKRAEDKSDFGSAFSKNLRGSFL